VDPLDSPGAAAAAPRSVSALADAVGRNLYAGLRLSLLRGVQREEFTASADAFAALIVLNLAVLFILGFLSVGGEGQFNLDELPRTLMFVSLTLAFGLLVERTGGTPGTMLLLSVALVAAGTVLTIAFGLLGLLLQHQDIILPSQWHWNALLVGGVVWWSLVLMAALRRLAPSNRGYSCL
jgi:hypothetical protein